VAASPNAFPQHQQADTAQIERGKSALWGTVQTSAMVSDARGGEGGPNLLRSELVLNDNKAGETDRDRRSERARLRCRRSICPTRRFSDVAAYIHSFRVAGVRCFPQRSAKHFGR